MPSLVDSAGDRFLGMRERFLRLPVLLQWATLPCIVFGLGWIDFLTGYEIQFFVIYILPVSFYAYCMSLPSSVVCSVLCATSFFVTDRLGGHAYSHSLIPVWNAAIRLATFVFIGFILDRLRRDLERELRLAHTDPLTGVWNRRSFHQALEKARRGAQNAGGPLTVGYLDLDGFKPLNDRLGHDAGDDALRKVAVALRSCLRAEGGVARMGGDEFAFFLPDTDAERAGGIARGCLEAIRAATAALPMPVHCSLGVVTFRSFPESTEAMVRRADALMYRRKGDGGDGFAQETAA